MENASVQSHAEHGQQPCGGNDYLRDDYAIMNTLVG